MKPLFFNGILPKAEHLSHYEAAASEMSRHVQAERDRLIQEAIKRATGSDEIPLPDDLRARCTFEQGKDATVRVLVFDGESILKLHDPDIQWPVSSGGGQATVTMGHEFLCEDRRKPLIIV